MHIVSYSHKEFHQTTCMQMGPNSKRKRYDAVAVDWFKKLRSLNFFHPASVLKCATWRTIVHYCVFPFGGKRYTCHAILR